MKGGGEAAEEMDISRGARIEEFLEATQVEGLYTECRSLFCVCVLITTIWLVCSCMRIDPRFDRSALDPLTK